MKDVKGKVAFVTGGASGIGLGIAMAFVKAGMKVVLADIREDHLETAVAHFAEKGQGASVRPIKLDVSDRAAFQRAAEEAISIFGKVHILCNNAGIGLIGPIKQTKFADWDWGVSVMLGGVVNGIQIFLPHMLSHGEGGHILSTSSMAGLLPIPRSTIYSTMKAGLIGMAEAMRSELGADGIGISVFCPGPVQTNIRETGRTRPKHFKDSGYLELEQQLEERPNSPNWMTIEECGERVLEGIRHDDLYILTHREFKEGVAARFEAILASFPDEKINEARANEIKYLTWNPIFTETLRARGR